MSDYTVAAEQMKEMLISEYLKRNPGLKRSDVTTKFSNGRIVVDAINNIIQNTAGRIHRVSTFSKKDKEILQELARGGDERYVECLHSIDNSQKIIDWLSQSTFVDFGVMEKKDHFDFLSKKNEIAGKRALDIFHAKQKLSQIAQIQTKASNSLIQTIQMEYMNAAMGQIKTQGAIYNKEIDLGNTFTSHVEKFIQSNIRKIKPNLNQNTLIAIAQAYQVTSDLKILPLEIPPKPIYEEMRESLNIVKVKLSILRNEFDSLTNFIHTLDTLLHESIRIDDTNINLETEPEPSTQSHPTSNHRMAYARHKNHG